MSAVGLSRPSSPAPRWQVAGLDVQVRRSARRRTLALQVRGGVVTAYAPATLPDATIRAFVEAKQGWLRQHVGEQRRRSVPPLSDGAALPFLGETLTLRAAAVGEARRDGSVLLVPAADPAGSAERWARREALQTYTALVETYAERLGARRHEVHQPAGREPDEQTRDGAAGERGGRDDEDEEVGAGRPGRPGAWQEHGGEEEDRADEDADGSGHGPSPSSTTATRSRVSVSTCGVTTAVRPSRPRSGSTAVTVPSGTRAA